MPSIRKQKAKARKSTELDMLSDYGNMDVMLGDGNSDSIEIELDGLINAPERRQDFQSFPNRENSSQENEIRDIDNRNEPVSLIDSINMLSGEMNARMSREMETMIDFMHIQINRAISYAISERIIPELQNMTEYLPLNHHDVEPCASLYVDGVGSVWTNASTKFTKKDSWSACDLRDHTDTTPYTLLSGVDSAF